MRYDIFKPPPIAWWPEPDAAVRQFVAGLPVDLLRRLPYDVVRCTAELAIAFAAHGVQPQDEERVIQLFKAMLARMNQNQRN